MAVIKFDKDKANTLIRDLNRIASDIESNLRRVHTNTSGKEISLYSSLLKVYDFRTITESVLQEDGTYVDETRTEQYLKYFKRTLHVEAFFLCARTPTRPP